jgi:hypothetical protein
LLSGIQIRVCWLVNGRWGNETSEQWELFLNVGYEQENKIGW